MIIVAIILAVVAAMLTFIFLPVIAVFGWVVNPILLFIVIFIALWLIVTR